MASLDGKAKSKPIFIAEIKTQSPFGFKSHHSFHKLMEGAIEFGDWVSVHTSALFGGDYESLAFVRRQTSKPILAKGFHSTDEEVLRALDHGADYVLVVDRFPSILKVDTSRCLLEFSKMSSVKETIEFSSIFKKYKFVCNQRDLNTGLFKAENEIEKFKKLGVWTCQASGIRSIKEVASDVDAFIVGEHLPDICNEMFSDSGFKHKAFEHKA